MKPLRSKARAAAVLCLALALVAGAAEAAKIPKDLPERYRDWLDEVDLLITKQERETFLEIEQDYQRDAFIERFWRARDPYPETARNEFRDRWDGRVAEARERFGDLTGDRARILLLNGLPDALIPYRCVELWPGEVWYYRRAETVGSEVVILFYQPGGLGTFRIWHPLDGIATLLKFANPGMTSGQQVEDAIGGCKFEEESAIRAAIGSARQSGTMGFNSLLAGMQTAPEGPSGEWVATFHSYSTDLPDGAATFPAELDLEFPGRKKSRTVVQGLVRVPRQAAAVSELAGHRSFNFHLTGEVLRDGALFDSFLYNFNLPEADVTGDEIPLVFERYLRPGDYRLVVKLEEMNGDAYFRVDREITVPRVETAVRGAPADPETARILAEANAAIASGETTLKIIPIDGELHTGMLRVDTLTTGSEIDRVVFQLDDHQRLTKTSPPWSLEVDLGSLPRMRTLTATAYDEDDNELARDVYQLNAGANRFATRLVEPRRGQSYERSLRAEAQIDVPRDQAVERVDFYLNETLVATVYQEPWVQPIVLPPGGQVAYVRAVAYQPDGNSTEDLVFVNAPEYLEEVDVQFVELYVTVLDRDRRPVDGLSVDAFEITEDGVPQTPMRFDLVTNLPIHAGVLLDVSASMDPSLELAKQAALGFFQQAIQPKDRATLITFNDHPNLAVQFTNDVQRLASGLAGLKAERGTALYDSLVFSLYYFNGLRGQRALIVLSDGKDEHSSFAYEDGLEYARRAGVAIYAIGLDLPRGDPRRKLTRIAEETGGRSFFVESAAELAEIYAEIERELRSRYYIAYQSTNTSGEDDFRTVEVEMAERGQEAKTLRGYYP